LLLYYYDYLRLLNIDVKKWSLVRRLQDPPIHRSWHPTFHQEMGTLRPPGLPLQGGKVPVGATAVSWAVPLLGIPCGNAPPVHYGSKLGGHNGPHWVGHSLRSAIRSMFFILSLFLVRSQL
jgi:hypothetical protein